MTSKVIAGRFKDMTSSDLAAALHHASMALSKASSEIVHMYGIPSGFANEDEEQAYGVLRSVLDTTAINEAYKSLYKGVYD